MERVAGALGDFETVLSKLGTIPENKTKFYLHWVRRFLKSCNYQLENINTHHVSQYLDSLEAGEKIANWQGMPCKTYDLSVKVRPWEFGSSPT